MSMVSFKLKNKFLPFQQLLIILVHVNRLVGVLPVEVQRSVVAGEYASEELVVVV